MSADPTGLAPALTTIKLFDSIALRVDGPKAWHGLLDEPVREFAIVTPEPDRAARASAGDGSGPHRR